MKTLLFIWKVLKDFSKAMLLLTVFFGMCTIAFTATVGALIAKDHPFIWFGLLAIGIISLRIMIWDTKNNILFWDYLYPENNK